MDLNDALDIISDILYNSSKELRDGLPGGPDEEWGYDEELVIEIAKACSEWQSRQSVIQDPYVVWFFDGAAWSKVTEEMYQEDAYKEWYKLTECGANQNNQSCDTYYFLASSTEELIGRHREEEADNFSARYLLSKSFGT